jgi:hypothetical protein
MKREEPNTLSGDRSKVKRKQKFEATEDFGWGFLLPADLLLNNPRGKKRSQVWIPGFSRRDFLKELIPSQPSRASPECIHNKTKEENYGEFGDGGCENAMKTVGGGAGFNKIGSRDLVFGIDVLSDGRSHFQVIRGQAGGENNLRRKSDHRYKKHSEQKAEYPHQCPFGH